MWYNYLSGALLITRIFSCSDGPYTCSDGTDLTTAQCSSSCSDSECTAPACCDGDYYESECDAYKSCSNTITIHDPSYECPETEFQCPTDGTTDIRALHPNECCSFMFHECCIKECGDELIHGLYYESKINGSIVGSCYYDYHDASQCDPDWLEQFTMNGTISYEAMCRGLSQEKCLGVTMDGHPVCLYDTSFRTCYSIQGDGAYPEDEDLTTELNSETTQTQIVLLIMSIAGGIIITFLAIAGCFALVCYYQDRKTLNAVQRIMSEELVGDTIHDHDVEDLEENESGMENQDEVMGVENMEHIETVSSETSVILSNPAEDTIR